MATMQIRNRNGFPESFDLNKYKPTKDFDIVDWAENLEVRGFYSLLVNSKGDDHRKTEGYRFAEMVLESPIFRNCSPSKPDGVSGSEIPSVTDVTVNDFFFGSFIDERYVDYRAAFDREIATGTLSEADRELLEIPLWQMYEKVGLSDEPTVSVNIDLYRNDEQILSDFAFWLKSTRKALSIDAPRRPVPKSEFSDWARFAVLPYIDLTLWAAGQSLQISQQAMGAALFPDELDVNVAERIRRVVAPTAKRVLSEPFVDALRSQARIAYLAGQTRRSVPEKFCNILVSENGYVPRTCGSKVRNVE